MEGTTLETLARLVASTPGLAEVLGHVLDRREASGKVPARVTLAAPAGCVDALRTILSARAVQITEDGRVRLDLVRADAALRRASGVGLDHVLYMALARTPRDPAAEEEALRRRLDDALAGRATTVASAAARAWLAAQRKDVAVGRGELVGLARERGLEVADAEAGAVVRCVDAALANDEQIRLGNFSARVLGRSKALLPGSDRLRRLCEALWDHDPATRAEVLLDGEPASLREAQFRALEAHGVTRDEGALSVLCFGPLVYEKEGVRFEEVARHAALGDVCRLTMQQLRRATLVALPVARVTIIENRTPFLDYAEALAARPELPRELVIASEGQAGWAVVTLLRLLARARLRVPVRQASDLDRSGVLIWRSLDRRSGLRLAPLALDVETHRRFRHLGLPVSAGEMERLGALIAVDPPDAPGHELLREIQRTGVWIEQEAIAREAIVPSIDEHQPIG